MVHLYKEPIGSNIPKIIIIIFLSIIIVSIMGTVLYNVLDAPQEKNYKWVMVEVKEVQYIPAHNTWPIVHGTFKMHIPETWQLKVFMAFCQKENPVPSGQG
jgi:hypothetical protein